MRFGKQQQDCGSREKGKSEGPERPDAEIRALLEGLGLGGMVIDRLALRAEVNGASLEQEILAERLITETGLYAAMAAFAGLGHMAVIDSDHIHQNPLLDTQLVRPTTLRLNPRQGPSRTIIVPELDKLVALRQTIRDAPMLAANMAVSTPSEVRRAVWQVGEKQRMHQTLGTLFDRRPDASARITLFAGQGFAAGLGLALCLATLVIVPEFAVNLFHVLLSLFYLASLALRYCATHFFRRMPAPAPLELQNNLPVYTVLVALYRESAVVAQLLERLSMLDWPVSRLDIKIVCEADDLETIAAVEDCAPGPQFEIVRVPPGEPRTKPKALSYALQGARGDFLAIYDAEDRPHPGQLREAYQTFARLGKDYACLQAPLVIANGGHGWLTAIFSIEYAGLFRGLLPFLARLGLPLPLGGTSNHFRTSVLSECGAWDPYNVTEDADLGMRLYRSGYRTATLLRPTLEDAPTDIGAWMGQRTRWFKGWLQTWLVMMRHPVRVFSDMGWAGTGCFHLLITSMLVSSLGHPLLLYFLFTGFSSMLHAERFDPVVISLFIIDLVNIIGSYMIFTLLGRMAMITAERRRIGIRFLMIPVYWMLLSAASWKAIFELRTNPFFWNKTEHIPASRSNGRRCNTEI